MDSVNVGVSCTRCETLVVVMPPETSKDLADGLGPDGELEFTAHIASGETRTGNRLAVADVNRRFRCPACGTIGQLPPSEERPID